MLSISFSYKQKEYYTLVRVKPRLDNTRLEVTIMNGELEKVFYGHHVFNLENGCVNCSSEPVDKEIRELHYQVRQAIDMFVHSHPLKVA